MTNFEQRLYKLSTVGLISIFIFLAGNIYEKTSKIPVIETKIDSLLERDEAFLMRFNNIEKLVYNTEKLVYNNDKRISIIESKN